jgi:outer membrane lipoprotein SlyB
MQFAGCVCLLALLGIAGCAQVMPDTTGPAQSSVRALPSREGIILSMRPVTTRGDRARWGVALLAAASGPTVASDDAPRQPTEFIIRTDAGSTISVVQTDEFGFHPGDRIIILHDDHTHLGRPG